MLKIYSKYLISMNQFIIKIKKLSKSDIMKKINTKEIKTRYFLS
jgi:hypothetical protein